ncbi:hypothetical protein JSE7799_02914 [Jannaschia seosinensis]|uniref:Uncharacterized protein n=1 Tax=Jannaschia seosinensis TaxID=313367 RepID=A0A0M7BED2_9RHOB|nr:hypothetical protein [Jannaschia seosinensis]CUH40184.1 hypothetical protein JSE7799_02914 [Jannaschia seosinensis]
MPAKESVDQIRTSEATKWDAVKTITGAALDFHITFLGCAKGQKHDEAIDATARARLLRILRAVSWVESAHGTAGANQPKRDPMQSGNPKDAWWKELTGQSGQGSRIVRGPSLTNLWANEVAAAAAAFNGFDANAAMGKLGDEKKGHDDSKFTPAHSYYWGVVYLIHRINTKAGDKTYQCGDLSRARLIDGAVEYNGGGVKDYRERIETALALIGDLSERAVDTPKDGSHQRRLDAVLLAEEMGKLKLRNVDLRAVKAEFDRDGNVIALSVEF